jgi:cardiolipin synthase
LGLFLLAGASDGLDGFLARTFHLHSELGAYLDALADKALLISIYITLAVAGAVPASIALVVVSRDVMIMGAVVISWIMDKPVEIRPLMVSIRPPKSPLRVWCWGSKPLNGASARGSA